MVRSNSESSSHEVFHLVERIRSQDKYFPISREQIQRELRASGYCEVQCVHEVMDDAGDLIGCELKLNITCRHSLPQTWKLALKLHATRIDGIDHEGRFTSESGDTASGWHRHGWDARRKSAERVKLSLDGFDANLSSREEFLIRAFKELRILLNKDDHGNAELPLS
jgi:hypothetical protein